MAEPDFSQFQQGTRASGRNAGKTRPNYSAMNATGKDEVAEQDAPTEGPKGRKRKASTAKEDEAGEEVKPAAKRVRTTKTAAKTEAPKMKANTASKKSTPSQKKAQTKRTPATKTTEKKTPQKGGAKSTQKAPQKAATQSAPAESLSKKTTEVAGQRATQTSSPSSSRVSGLSADELAEADEVQEPTPPSSMGQKGESESRGSQADSHKGLDKLLHSRVLHNTNTYLNTQLTNNALSPSAPNRQFFSTTAFPSKMQLSRAASPASSELSDVPSDLDGWSPRRGGEAATASGSPITRNMYAQNDTGASSSMAPPTSTSLRSRRDTKPISRFGNLAETATVIPDVENEIQFDPSRVPSLEVDAEKGEGGAEEEVMDIVEDEKDDEFAPESKKAQKAPARQRKPTPRKPAAPKATRTPSGGSNKRKSTGEPKTSRPPPAKRKRSSVVVLPTPNLSPSTIDSAAPSTPAAKKSAAKRKASGLLTPPDSQPSINDGAALEDLSAIDPRLVQLSEKLTAREPLASKPLPQGQPEVWAASRQALCETVPYFKMPQSGCHSNDSHVYSFLFDAAGHCREYADPDVIISRAGGGMESDATGQLQQKQDHKMNQSQVQAVLNDIQLQNPLVIIAGNKYAGAVCKMPYRYNVLGWYKPIAVWGEKTMGKGKKTWTTIKYRFERLGSKEAWHAPSEDLVTEDDRRVAGPLRGQSCNCCKMFYPNIYLMGWMCLNPDCGQFWKINGSDAPYGKLHYNPAFLLHRTAWQVEEEPYSVKPPVPDVGNSVGDDLTYINTRGICCPQCGRCNSRRLFKGWTCENPTCDFANFPKHIPVKVPMLHTPMDNTGDGPALARNKHGKGVKVSINHTHGFKVYTYTVDGVNGKFVHAVANAKINRQQGGPDDMFHAIQDQSSPEMDLRLERRRFGVEKMGGNKAEAATEAQRTIAATPANEQVPPLTLAAQDTESPVIAEGSRFPTPLLQELRNAASEIPSVPIEESTAIAQQPPELAPALELEGLNPEGDANIPEADSQPRVPELGEPSTSATDQADAVLFENGSAASTSQETPAIPQATQTVAVAQDPVVSENSSAASTSQQPPPVLPPHVEGVSQDLVAKNEAVQDGDFMTAFSMNYGMPYKFVASGSSMPFTEAPWPVRAVRADLNWASQTFLDPKEHEDFNEELIFAYMEGQKIEYHDDGEEGLGPRIATQSLGGKAKMHLRMKMKHFTGCSKTGILTEERPVPGGIDGPEGFQKRLAAWEEIQPYRTTNRPLYGQRRKEIPQELGLFANRKKHADDLVTVTLNHGDIVLMEGYEIQQYLEHKVVPEQCLRFALTCRVVLPDHLKPEERPSYDVEPDDESMSSLRRMAARHQGC